MVTCKIYVEGGGDRKDLKSRCREGFRKFFEKAGLAGRMPRIIACGGRRSAYDDFCTALRIAKPDELIFLLVDSEGPVKDANNPWIHLSSRKADSWIKPDNAGSDNVHLMVQCMESWFLADTQALVLFYGQGFRFGSLPANPHIEQVPMSDVLRGLKDASISTSKGSYSKGDHSFGILGLIEPAKVRKASAHADRLIDSLCQEF